MPTVYRSLGYTATVQRLTVTADMGSSVTVYLWGGGGGGGGADSPGNGGAGQAGGYSEHTFNVSPGDVIDIAVGGPGGGGQQGYVTTGGTPGSSYASDAIFNTRSATGTETSYPITCPAWCAFLNQTGVWNNPGGYGSSFDSTYSVYFPFTGSYSFTASGDNAVYIYLDNSNILSMPGEYTYRSAFTTTRTVSAGYHSVRAQAINFGGPGSVGLTIVQLSGASYSGAPGGNQVPWSGAGGGGGGATVAFLNGVVVAVGGGGGGGGGGGHLGNPYGQNAPGPNGQSASATNGSAGQSNSSDGAGGGGGGGGYFGGQGGAVYGGDSGAYAGAGGGCLGTTTVVPTNNVPYQGTYYSGSVARGGAGGVPGGNMVGSSGTSGYAVVKFEVNGSFVKSGGVWNPVEKIYVKQSGTWTPVQTVYVKKDGVWNPVVGSQDRAPVFSSIPGYFGVSYRPYGSS